MRKTTMSRNIKWQREILETVPPFHCSTIRLYSSQYLACYLINLCSFTVLMAFRERINTLYELFPFRRNTSGEKLDAQISIKKFRNVKNTLDDNLLDDTIKTDVKMVKECLEEGANVNCHYEDMMIPLHIAAENGHEEMLNILLKYSSKYIDSKTLFGDTALLIATRNEHKSIMRKLLKNGANVNCTDSCGRTPLHVAALKKNPDIAKLLIAYGANVNTMDSYGEHVLCTAVITSPNPPVAYALLKNGANINCINRQGMSLLCEAILSAHTKTSVDAVKMLLRRGANVNVCNIISGQTPLHIAALTGNRAIVELLIGAGADTKIKDRSGRTPRDIAIQYGYPLLKEKMRGSLAGTNPVRLSSVIKRQIMHFYHCCKFDSIQDMFDICLFFLQILNSFCVKLSFHSHHIIPSIHEVK